MKLYKIIRESGGWDNWNMEIVDYVNCNDIYDARLKEKEYSILLHATLNSIQQVPKSIVSNTVLVEQKPKKKYYRRNLVSGNTRNVAIH
jgi:predicted RNA methylase